MKLLVSPVNVEEARICKLGGADIIDVKNPKEGSLGANFPWMIKAVKQAAGHIPVSATIGDFNYKPGTASLAALGAAVSGADYIKVGLYDIQTNDQALRIARRPTRRPRPELGFAGVAEALCQNRETRWDRSCRPSPSPPECSSAEPRERPRPFLCCSWPSPIRRSGVPNSQGPGRLTN